MTDELPERAAPDAGGPAGAAPGLGARPSAAATPAERPPSPWWHAPLWLALIGLRRGVCWVFRRHLRAMSAAYGPEHPLSQAASARLAQAEAALAHDRAQVAARRARG